MSKDILGEMATDIKDLQSIFLELGGPSEDVVPAGISYELIKEKFEDVLKKISGIREKFKDSPVEVEGFSISIGAALINSSTSLNFKFK